jgi:quercetin dioxygenase-like cupin family protein
MEEPMNDIAAVAPHPTVAKKSAANLVAGRRAFFKYRDLGVTAATAGKLRAQVTSAESGMSQPTGWHIHKCEAQLVYMLSGWIELEFAGEPLCRLEAGDSILIPGGTPHNELRTSDTFELLEVSLPAEMATEPCDAPR